tara:strand:+ start:216 stop:629 length:414 start_codon:yes stop_codon:yes gene_type:complete
MKLMLCLIFLAIACSPPGTPADAPPLGADKIDPVVVGEADNEPVDTSLTGLNDGAYKAHLLPVVKQTNCGGCHQSIKPAFSGATAFEEAEVHIDDQTPEASQMVAYPRDTLHQCGDESACAEVANTLLGGINKMLGN